MDNYGETLLDEDGGKTLYDDLGGSLSVARYASQ